MNDKMNEETNTDAKVKTFETPIFSDSEALASAASQSAANEAIGMKVEPQKPNFFKEDDSDVTIEVDVWSDPSNGRIVSVMRKGELESSALEKLLMKTEHYFKFTMPNYDEICTYRQKSSRYIGKEQVVDITLFRNFILLGHLAEWSLCDKEGNPVAIERESDGTLSFNTIAWINKLHVVIWDVVFTLFERETLIS